MQNSLYLLFASVLFISTASWAQPASPITVIDASSPNVCDGSAYLTNPNNAITNSIVWYSGNGAILAQGVTSVSNLCAGTYGVYYTTFIDSVSVTFVITGTPCNGLQAVLSSTSASSPTAMDGSATVVGIGGLSPYSFTWSNGATTSTISGLGVGMYYCCVTDANGCQSCDSIAVSATVNPGQDTVLLINNNNIPNVIDSLAVQQVLDCSLDYNAIGSAFISGSQYLPAGNPNTLDSLYLTWQVYDTMVPANLLATYTIGYGLIPPLAQAYTASLSIHCPQKNTNLNTLLVIDQFYTAQLAVDTKEWAPSICIQDGCASVQLLPAHKGTLTVYSLNGLKVAEQALNQANPSQFSIAQWTSGVYFLQYNLSSGVQGVVRFVIP